MRSAILIAVALSLTGLAAPRVVSLLGSAWSRLVVLTLAVIGPVTVTTGKFLTALLTLVTLTATGITLRASGIVRVLYLIALIFSHWFSLASWPGWRHGHDGCLCKGESVWTRRRP